jgi:hypothetical protein
METSAFRRLLSAYIGLSGGGKGMSSGRWGNKKREARKPKASPNHFRSPWLLYVGLSVFLPRYAIRKSTEMAKNLNQPEENRIGSVGEKDEQERKRNKKREARKP